MSKLEIYDDFIDSLNKVKRFKYLDEWKLLIGKEKVVDYVRELTDVSSLDVFDAKKHLNNGFTGFVNSENKKVRTKFYCEDYINYLFIENGKIRYFQYEFPFGKPNKLYFFDDNFKVLKGYGGNLQEEGFLSYVHIHSVFNFNNLNIQYDAINASRAMVYFSFNGNKSFMSLELNEDGVNNLEEGVFKEDEKIKDFFGSYVVKVFGVKNYFDKSLNFFEGMEFIKKY